MGFVSRHEESELGAWTQHTWQPIRLSGLVEQLWMFDGKLQQRERHYPTGELDLILQLDAPFRVVEGPSAAECPAAGLAGLIVAPLVIETPAERSRVLGVTLRPAGAFALFGVPLHELTGNAVDLHDLIGDDARRLAERLDEASSDRARLQLLGGWITGRLAEGRSTDPRIAYAVSEIERTDGRAAIATIVEQVDVAQRRFTSRFEEQVGVKPKLFARIVRFRKVAAALRAGPASFGEMAQAFGYYDQAHMNADFREFMGMSPGRYRAAVAYPESPFVVD